MNGETYRVVQTSNNNVLSTRFKKYASLHSRTADDNDYVKAYNVNKNPHIKLQVWQEAAREVGRTARHEKVGANPGLGRCEMESHVRQAL